MFSKQNEKLYNMGWKQNLILTSVSAQLPRVNGSQHVGTEHCNSKICLSSEEFIGDGNDDDNDDDDDDDYDDDDGFRHHSGR
jgi:hypothetical protein